MKQTTRNRIIAVVVAPLLALGAVGCKSKQDASLSGDMKGKAPITEFIVKVSPTIKQTCEQAKAELNGKLTDGNIKIRQLNEALYAETGPNDAAETGSMTNRRAFAAERIRQELEKAEREQTKLREEMDGLKKAIPTKDELKSGYWLEGPCGYVPAPSRECGTGFHKLH